MGWKTIREHEYYYLSRREGERVVSTYVGSGPAAALAAIDVQCRRQDRALRAEEIAELEALSRHVRFVTQHLRQAVRARLIAAGFHQHDRGKWRKKRGTTQQEVR